MNVLKPDLYTEAANLLFQKIGGYSYGKMREDIGRFCDDALVGRLFEACDKMEQACRDINIPDSPLNIKLGGNRGIADCLWRAYYEVAREEKPSGYFTGKFKNDGGILFLSMAVGRQEDADEKNGEEIRRLLMEADLTPEVKYRLLEICMEPEPVTGLLCETIERIAQVIAPYILEAGPLYRIAKRFFEAPDADTVLKDRIHVSLSAPVTVLPILTGLNMAYLLDQRIGQEEKTVLYAGLLFLCVDVFRGMKELTPEILSEKLRCFTDETKLKIIMILAEGPSYQAAMAKKLGLSPATISHHLDYLANNGLVSDEIRENRIYYHLEREHAAFLADELKRMFG